MTSPLTNGVERVKCIPPLTRTQLKIAELLAANLSVEDVATRLGVGATTVKFHIREAADRIPGCWPGRMRLIMWWLGCSLGQLEATESPEAHLRRAMGIGPH